MLKSMLGAVGLAGMLLVAAAAPTPTLAQTMFRPVAVVNDSAITGFDLAQRAQLLATLGFTAASPDALRAEALDRLIDDRLKVQEAKRLGIAANEEALKAGIDDLAQQVELSGNEFRAALSAQGVGELAIADLVAAELVWREVVRGRFGRRVEPGEAEIDAEIALAQSRAGVSYRVQEIGLPLIDDGRTEAQTRELAEQLYISLSQGGDFDAAVRKYSRAASAARGGDVGWLATLRMPPEVNSALSELELGQVARPIPVTGGFSILKLIDKRVDAQNTADPANQELREQIRQRLINQRTARLAEGLLQELRRDALIELR